jgi:putative DNA primase/helicase
MPNKLTAQAFVNRLASSGLTEAFQAERFVAQYGADWRFDHSRKLWMEYQAPLWRPEAPGKIKRLLITSVREFQQQAKKIRDTAVRDKALSFAKFCQGGATLDRILRLAQSLLPVAIDSSTWDRDSWLLGAPNGIIDLKKGRLLVGSRESHISRSLGVPYDAHAACTRWIQFLNEIFDNDAALIAYIHRMLGYFLTGQTNAQLWWLFYGTGANGKTTLLNTLAHILGEYGQTVPFSMFQLQQQRSSIPDDLATLPGKRVIYASETIEGKRLDESRMKQLTGSDRIAARPLFGRWFDFDPTHKVVLSCNHKPVVKDDSPGFWRRVHVVPFTQHFSDTRRDNQLEEKLRAEAPGILAWMVRGCITYQAEGLTPPPSAISVLTLGYQHDSDHIPDFLLQCCDEQAGAECPAKLLQERYQSWTVDQHLSRDQVHSPREFAERMTARFPRDSRRSGRVYLGVALRPTTAAVA